MPQDRILVVDDEPGVRASLQAILEDEGYRVSVAASGEEALDSLDGVAPDAILLDVWLPGIDGLETLQRLRARSRDASCVMISGHGTIDTAVRATKLGAFDFIEKPLSLEKTLLVVRNALRQRKLEARNQALLEQLARDTEIRGRSEASARLRRAVEAAAASDAPVLLRGEPGSGRETVARRVHAAGRRADRPFVPVPCGALDAAAGGRVLFGDDGISGRWGLASGGTLFLEDVDRLDPVIQERLAATASSSEDEARSVRVIASAPAGGEGIVPSLAALVDVVRIDVPALRDRRGDVDLLAALFMRDLAREYGRPERRFAPQALAAMSSYGWPGNVRELRNVVERLLLLAPDEIIEPRDLPVELGGESAPAEDLYREFPTLADGVAAFERYYVRRAWHASKFDLEASARALGLTVAAFEARLRTLGMA